MRTTVGHALACVLVLLSAQAGLAGDYMTNIARRGEPPVRLHVSERGAGAPIVLLHGLGLSAYSWRKVIPDLAQAHRVVAVDLKGHGISDKPDDGRYGPVDHARAISSLVKHLDLSGVTLVGHSLGGLVAVIAALELERSRPGTVSRLVLVDAPLLPHPLPAAAGFVQLPVIPEVMMAMATPEEIAAGILLIDDGTLEGVTARDLRVHARPYRQRGGVEAYLATARALADYIPNIRPGLLDRLRIPTLLLWCRADMKVPLATAKRAHRRIRTSQLTIIDGCDHDPQEQQPKKLLSAIGRFLE